MTWYNASKAAVISVTQSMAAELAPEGIRVNAIAPTAAHTPMLEAMFGDRLQEGIDRVLATIPLGRLCQGADVAAAALYLASADAEFVTGIVLPVDGGWPVETEGKPQTKNTHRLWARLLMRYKITAIKSFFVTQKGGSSGCSVAARWTRSHRGLESVWHQG
jgi:hypothetical protein